MIRAMRITVVSVIVGENINDLRSITQVSENGASIVLFPKKLYKNQEKIERQINNDSHHLFTELLDKLAVSFLARTSHQESASASNDTIECLLISFLFMSIRFFPEESICLVLPPDICRMLDMIALRHRASIPVISESSRACCYEIERSFLESNIIYSSAHSEVYKYAISRGYCAIKIATDALREGSLFLANCEFRNQNVIQKAVFGVNTARYTFRSMCCKEYIEGSQIHGMLSRLQEEALIESVLRASKAMRSIQYSNIGFETIPQKIASCIDSAGDAQTARLGRIIREYWEAEMGEGICAQLCLYDLHRDNLVLSQDGWHIIDADFAVRGTESFMVSCLLAASFLLEGYSPEYLLEKMLMLFPTAYARVAVEIIVRLYIGISYFSRGGGNNDFFARYVNAMERFVILLRARKELFSEMVHNFSDRLLSACEAIAYARK